MTWRQERSFIYRYGMLYLKCKELRTELARVKDEQKRLRKVLAKALAILSKGVRP